MTCVKCLIRSNEESYIQYLGSKPVCFFDNPIGNWMCATIIALRDYIYENENSDTRINYQYCEDNRYVTINIHEVKNSEGCIGLCLYLEWYKQRGRIHRLYILGDCIVKIPTEEDCLAILSYLETTKDLFKGVRRRTK